MASMPTTEHIFGEPVSQVNSFSGGFTGDYEPAQVIFEWVITGQPEVDVTITYQLPGLPAFAGTWGYFPNASVTSPGEWNINNAVYNDPYPNTGIFLSTATLTVTDTPEPNEVVLVGLFLSLGYLVRKRIL